MASSTSPRFNFPPPPDDGVRFHRTLSVEPTFAPPPPPVDSDDDDIGVPGAPPPPPPGNPMDVYPLEEDTEDTAEAAPSKGICGLGKEFMRDDISSDEANEEDLVFTRGITAPSNAPTGDIDQSYDVDSSDDGGDDDHFSDHSDHVTDQSDRMNGHSDHVHDPQPLDEVTPTAPEPTTSATNSYIDVDGVDGALPIVTSPAAGVVTSPLGMGSPLSPGLLRKTSLAKLPHVAAPAGTTAYAFTFHRAPGGKLGVQLAGGALQRGSSFGVDVQASSDIVNTDVAVPHKWVGLFVKRLTPGGAAAVAGQFQVGDQLLSVNGVSFLKLSHQAAVEVLASAPADLEVVIARRDVSPQSIAPQASGLISPGTTLSPGLTSPTAPSVTSPLQHGDGYGQRSMSATSRSGSRAGTFTRPNKRPPPPPTGALRGSGGVAPSTPTQSPLPPTTTPPTSAAHDTAPLDARPMPRPRTSTTASTATPHASPAGGAPTGAQEEAGDEAKRRAAEVGVAALLSGPRSPEHPVPRPRTATTIRTTPDSGTTAHDDDNTTDLAHMDISVSSSQGMAEALMSANSENPARMNTATKNRLIALLGNANDEEVEAVANDDDTSGDDEETVGSDGTRRKTFNKGKNVDASEHADSRLPTSPLREHRSSDDSSAAGVESPLSPSKTRSSPASDYVPITRSAHDPGLICKNRCGWMLKQGGGTKTIMSRKNWKRRFFVLKESMLFYYKPEAVLPDESGVKPGVTATGYINLSAESKVGQPTERRILLEQPNRDFAFICPSRTSAREWHEAISVNLRVIIQQTISAFQSKHSKATQA